MLSHHRLSILVLLLAAAMVALATAAPTNRLVHRGGAGPKGGLSDLLNRDPDRDLNLTPLPNHRHKRKGGRRAMERFAVLHADAIGPDALNVLLDAQSSSNQVWLYGDLPRWSSEHVEHLWTFACGRTQGRWPMCGHEGLGPDPFDPVSVRDHERLVKLLHGFEQGADHKHARQKRSTKAKRGQRAPGAVGFGLDLNLLLGNRQVQPALVEASARVVVVTPGSLTRAALREAAHGTLSPLTATIPGRNVGVARSQYAPDTPFQAKGRHLNLMCADTQDPDNLVRGLRRQEQERDALRAAARDLRQAGLAVMELNLDTILEEPGHALDDLYWFLLDGDDTKPPKVSDTKPPEATNRMGITDMSGTIAYLPDVPKIPVVTKPVRELLRQLEVTPEILMDCAEALKASRVRLAVDDRYDAKALLADVDQVLGEIRRVQKQAKRRRK